MQPMTIDPHTMTVADVARALGISTARVLQLGEELLPTRSPSNHRRYDPAVVQRFATKRERAKDIATK